MREALPVVEDKIPPEGCQGQTGSDGLKRSLLFNSTVFRDTEHIVSGEKDLCR